MSDVPRRALIVGIDNYVNASNLGAAVSDARAMAKLLQHHEDNTPNYECITLLDNLEDGRPITRAGLRHAIVELFENFAGDALFYFSGHGVLGSTGGYLATFDAQQDDWGVPMQEVVQLANDSRARNVLLILDCCHSGDIANPAILRGRDGADPLAVIRENVTVIASSRDSEVSVEAAGHGLFTAAVIDALDGGAADHMGWVTAPAIYTYVERRFGAWDQRPVYKSHATCSSLVRECAPLIERVQLYELTRHFTTQDYRYPLDPEHEPEDENGDVHKPVNDDKVAVAQLFKVCRDAGLLRPSTPNEQLYWTARRGNTVELTLRGREYWRLVKGGRI